MEKRRLKFNYDAPLTVRERERELKGTHKTKAYIYTYILYISSVLPQRVKSLFL